MEHQPLLGIHHVTAICGDAQRNLDFYTQKLGLRLVKITINYDDPTAYHIYYGDSVGSPGTVLTFFSYPSGAHGSTGGGMFSMFTLGVPMDSLGFWKSRLSEFAPEWYVNGLGEKSLMVNDPDGLKFHLMETEIANPKAWTEVVEPDHAIQQVASVTLASRTDASRLFLQEKLRLESTHSCPMESGQKKLRFPLQNQALDLIPLPTRCLGGRGTIHHVAFRTATERDQQLWISWLNDHGSHPSEVKDRHYFHSIYFREPSGALCEIATDKPGFLVDESESKLGSSLQLPKALQKYKDDLEISLPKLKLPAMAR